MIREFGLTLIVLNNNGGGIFNFLPFNRPFDTFERVVGTPHGLDFRHAAQMFGLNYEKPASRSAFEDAYAQAVKGRGATLIEIVTDREQNVTFHRELYDLAKQTVEQN